MIIMEQNVFYLGPGVTVSHQDRWQLDEHNSVPRQPFLHFQSLLSVCV